MRQNAEEERLISAFLTPLFSLERRALTYSCLY